MLKLVHTGDLWFMEYDQRLYCRIDPCTTLDEWDVVTVLYEADYDVLKKEFASVRKLFKRTDTGSYVLKKKPATVPVRDVTPDDDECTEQFHVKTIWIKT